MTQEQALIEFQKMRPEVADKLGAERIRKIGMQFGSMNEFRLWDYSTRFRLELISSSVSWEVAVAKAHAATIEAAAVLDESVIVDEHEVENSVVERS